MIYDMDISIGDMIDIQYQPAEEIGQRDTMIYLWYTTNDVWSESKAKKCGSPKLKVQKQLGLIDLKG